MKIIKSTLFTFTLLSSSLALSANISGTWKHAKKPIWIEIRLAQGDGVVVRNDKFPDNLTNAIRITVRSEYLSYRLLLIHEIDLPKFERINSLDELNTLVTGLHNDWNTTWYL